MSSNSFYLNNTKFDVFYELNGKNYEIVEISNARFIAGLSIHNSKITNLSIINETKIKGNLIFKNCVFYDTVEIKKINCQGSIDFIDCQFHKSIKVYSCKIKDHLNFLDVQIGGNLLIQNLQTLLLNIEEVKTKNIRLNSITGSVIDSIRVYNSTVEYQFNISETHNSNLIQLSNCNIGFLFSIKKEVNKEGIIIHVKDSYLKNLKINNVEAEKTFSLKIDECITDKIQVTKCKSRFGLIDLKNTVSSGITKISDVATRIKIDISTLVTSDLIIDDLFYLNLANGRLSSQLFLDDTNQQISTLKVLEKYFHQIADTRLQDKITYLLKDLEIKNKSCQKDKHLLYYKIHHFIGKYFFGWGIKLRWIFLSFGGITLFFAVIYFLLMNHCNNFSFEFKEFYYNGFLSPLELSTFYMLGFYSDINVSCINSFVSLSQHIIGIAYITLIIGVGIRKLVN